MAKGLGHLGVQNYICELLWSINEQLSGREGVEVPRIGRDWINDLEQIAGAENARYEKYKNRR